MPTTQQNAKTRDYPPHISTAAFISRRLISLWRRLPHYSTSPPPDRKDSFHPLNPTNPDPFSLCVSTAFIILVPSALSFAELYPPNRPCG